MLKFFLFYFNKNFNASSSILKINAIRDFKNFKNQHLFSFLKKKSILINKNFFLFSNFLTFPNVSSSFFKESESSLFIDTFLYTKNLTQKTKKLLKLKNKIKKSKTIGLSQKFILPNCFLKRVFKVMFKKSYFVKNFKSFLFFFLKQPTKLKSQKFFLFFFKKKKNSFVNTRKIKNFLLCDLSTKNTFFTKKVFFNDFLIGKNNSKKSLTFFFSTFRNDCFFFLQTRFF
uniref:Uncharacterized protein n=1 Tax=Oxytricha trifallax TaxID=1172189 RepID=G9HRI2_9SPIT|nr:hypothetical protein [Oxytricha trifallax]